jgi:acyl CoA:acetate/3-ketoacid CoA transferase
VNLERDVLAQAGFPLRVAADLKSMPDNLFLPAPIGLALKSPRNLREAAE